MGGFWGRFFGISRIRIKYYGFWGVNPQNPEKRAKKGLFWDLCTMTRKTAQTPKWAILGAPRGGPGGPPRGAPPGGNFRAGPPGRGAPRENFPPGGPPGGPPGPPPGPPKMAHFGLWAVFLVIVHKSQKRPFLALFSGFWGVSPKIRILEMNRSGSPKTDPRSPKMGPKTPFSAMKWNPPRTPIFGGDPPGTPKSAHFVGYLITLPVGTEFEAFRGLEANNAYSRE